MNAVKENELNKENITFEITHTKISNGIQTEDNTEILNNTGPN